MARPKAVPNITLEKQIEQLGSIHASWDEIAAITGMKTRTIQRTYGEAFKKGLQKGKTSLKRKMFEMAMNGHATMLIWLSKQHLGYTDKVEQRVDADVKTDVVYSAEWGNKTETADAKENS